MIRSALNRDSAVTSDNCEGFFTLLRIGVMQVHPDTLGIARVNSKLCEIAGYSEAELLDCRVTDLIDVPPAGAGADRWYLSERKLARKDGSRIGVRVSGLLVYDESGRAGNIVVTVEPEHDGQASAWQAAFDSPGICVLVVESDGRIRLANRTFEAMFGYRATEVTGRHFSLLFPESSRGDPEGPFRSDEEVSALRKSGSTFPAEVSVKEVATPEGKLRVVFVADISVRRRLQEERDSFFNLSPEPLCIRNLDGNFRHVNPAMVNIVGWSEVELRGRPYLEFVPEEERPKVAAAIRGLREGRPMVHLEHRHLCRVGGWRWLQWNAPAVLPGTTLIYAAARDVTQVKATEERLRALTAQLLTTQEEERGRIARELHDNVTQRLAILGIELGLLRQSAEPTVGERLSGLQTQILQLSEEVRELSHSVHPGILEHDELAVALEMHCQDFARCHGIAARVVPREVPPAIPRPVVLGLYRIAQEALQNVAKHSGATTVTVMLTSPPGGGLRLAVIDNGCGFDVDQVTPPAGLGLLSIRERARLIGAQVTICSVPGEGTTLGVELAELAKV